MSGRNVILLGATGMVGGEVLRLCLADPRVARVTVLGRKSVGVSDPKLTEVLHQDFGDFSGLEGALEAAALARVLAQRVRGGGWAALAGAS